MASLSEADARTRTGDPFITSEVLYQLSYVGAASSLASAPLTRYRGSVPPPRGFEYVVRGGDVVITHHGRAAAPLRGAAAKRFLAKVERDDPQHVMARTTGNYKRGNER